MKQKFFASSLRVGVSVLLALLLTFSIASESAQAVLRARKISGGTPPFADVDDEFLISNDSRYVVFAEDREIDGVYGVYSALLSGGDPVRLTPPARAGRGYPTFLISPDSQWVVYCLDVLINGLYEVFSVPISGGTPIRLNRDLVNGDWVSMIDISPDSLRVSFVLTDSYDHPELYSAPIDGSEASLKLSQYLYIDRKITSTAITPNSEFIVYNVDATTHETFELWYSPLTASDPKTLSGPVVAGGDVTNYKILPDSSGVVYYANQFVTSIHNIYRADFYSGDFASVDNLSNCLADFETLGQFEVTADSQTVVFSGDCWIDLDADLYKVPANGSASPTRLSHATGTEPDRRIFFEITPNQQGVVFEEWLTSPDVGYLLYGNYLFPPLPTPLLISNSGPEWNGIGDFAVALNSEGVVFNQSRDGTSMSKLFARKLSPSVSNPIIPLTPVGPVNGDIEDFKISPNSLAVVFMSHDYDLGEPDELFLVPSVGGAATKISAPFTREDEFVYTYQITPDNKRVVYLNYADGYGDGHLFVVEDVRLSFLPMVRR